MYSFITGLRVLACLLITNFHFDILYPEKFRLLAFGGDLGNNLFFMISGFCLYSSVNGMKFGKWLKKRYSKILPAVLIIELLSAWAGGVKFSNLGEIVRYFLFPTPFWFTGAIIIFYPVFYLAARWMKEKSYGIYLFLLLGTVIHLKFDGIQSERYIVGFLAMLAGYYLYGKLSNRSIHQISRKLWIKNGIYTVLVLFLYVFLKLLRIKEIGNTVLIHYGIGMSTIAFAGLAIVTAFYLEQYLEAGKNKLQHSRLRFLNFIAGSTLEIYLVQSFKERSLICLFKDMVFPVNYLLTLCMIILTANLLKFLMNRISALTACLGRKRI